MALLDSLLAFALTLAVLATVVTLLLETLIRVFGLKRKGQVEIVSRLFEDSLSDVVPDARARWQAVKAVLENPFATNKMAGDKAQQGYLGSQANGIYAEVSLEHLLRRLTESFPAADLVAKTQAEVKAELESISRKYDELASALSADFKRRAQLWSILIGMAFALGMNIDGLRILETYLQDPELRRSVIEKVEIPESAEVEAAAQAAPDDEDLKAQVAAINERIDAVKAQLDGIGDLGLPIGPTHFPYCSPLTTAKKSDSGTDRLCQSDADIVAWYDYPFWLVKVLVTGLLIGLGAPFWYDVARRLAAVRTVLGGKGSGEEQHRGSDAKDDPAEREALIGRVAADARASAASRIGGTG